MMTSRQREMARHALGLPNSRNMSYRNHFCIGPQGDGYQDWLDMVVLGYAVQRTGPHWGGDDMFHLTLKGALLAREPKEYLSPEDTDLMRVLEMEDSIHKVS